MASRHGNAIAGLDASGFAAAAVFRILLVWKALDEALRVQLGPERKMCVRDASRRCRSRASRAASRALGLAAIRAAATTLLVEFMVDYIEEKMRLLAQHIRRAGNIVVMF
jgi:hypothetical protein